MLKSLIIEDFQSHKSTELDFVSGINIIAGTSMSGKTAILRALNWCLYNRPLGDGFIRYNCLGSSVGVGANTDNVDFTVLRHKSDKDNFYEIMIPDKEPHTLRAFGSDTPNDVKQLFNISDINIQEQLSPHFLILDSPRQIALYIRSVMQLDEIDTIVSSLASKIKKTTNDVEKLKKEGETIDKELGFLQLLPLDKLEESLVLVDSNVIRIDFIQKDNQYLEQTINSLKFLDVSLDKIRHIDFNRCDAIFTDIKNFGDVKNKVSKECIDLHRICSTLQSIVEIVLPKDVDETCALVGMLESRKVFLHREVGSLSKVVVELEQVLVDSEELVLPTDLDDMCEVLDELESERKAICLSIVILEDLSIKLRNSCYGIDVFNISISESETERFSVLNQLKECPSCGQELDRDAKFILLGTNHV